MAFGSLKELGTYVPVILMSTNITLNHRRCMKVNESMNESEMKLSGGRCDFCQTAEAKSPSMVVFGGCVNDA